MIALLENGREREAPVSYSSLEIGIDGADFASEDLNQREDFNSVKSNSLLYGILLLLSYLLGMWLYSLCFL